MPLDNLPIPEDGLYEVLSAWNGRGILYEALLANSKRLAETAWTAQEIVARASRILLDRVEVYLKRWPLRVEQWLELLPVESYREEHADLAPFPGVSWPDTYRVHGWPPTVFVGRQRKRELETQLVSSVRWTLDYLLKAIADASISPESRTERFDPYANLARSLLDVEPLVLASGQRPGRPEILAIRGEGFPWSAFADVAEEFRTIEADLFEYATRLLGPLAEARETLFHLGILGVVLRGARDANATILSLSPIGAGKGFAYRLTDEQGREWHVWFEAGAAWRRYAAGDPPYERVAVAVHPKTGTLRPDVLLLRPGAMAIVIECKYTSNREYVGHDGYRQALAYLAEAKTVLAPEGMAIVVAPEGVASRSAFARTSAGLIGIARPADLRRIVTAALRHP